MKFYKNLFEIQLKIKALIVLIILLSNVCHILSSYLPFTSCSANSGCHYPSTRCDNNVKWCECNKKYQIPFISSNVCLDYRNLGEVCLQSKQCSRTPNSVCLTSEGIQMESIKVDNNLIDKYFGKTTLYSLNINQNNGNGLGQCRCKRGFKQMANNKCYRLTFSNMTCTGAFECLEIDLNSHCDKSSRQCHCDPGYVFDVDKNECRIITKKFGYICKDNYECYNWDQNMECHNLQCFCQKGYYFDITTQRCKQSEQKIANYDSKYQICNLGYHWDQESSRCERQQWGRYDFKQGDYRYFSLDKFLETIVVVIFCCVTIAFLRFWRYILPQNIVSESQNGMFSDFSHTNRVHRRRGSRSNSLSRRGRVIQLRVNLDSPDSDPESENIAQGTFVALPMANSHSSLPTYESTTVMEPMIDRHPPPYTDEPPTYEEAMKLFQTSKL